MFVPTLRLISLQVHPNRINIERHRHLNWLLYRFWFDFESQLGVMLSSEVAQRPPQMPPNTRSGARNRPDPLQILIDY